MRHAWVLLLLLAACKEERPATRAAPPAPGKAPDAPGATGKLGGFTSHPAALAAGRRLGADEARLGEARAAFEAALQLEPGDPAALSELGWVQFRQGDLAVALATTDRAIAAAEEPALQAASLYNRGRILEAQGDVDGARAAYRASLELRLNDTVAARLAKLGPPAGAPAAPPAAGAGPPAAGAGPPDGVAALAASYPSVRAAPWPTLRYACADAGCTPRVHEVIYGDLEGDGVEEAVVVMSDINPPTDDQTAHLYGLRDGKVRWLGRVHAGGLEHPEYNPAFVEASFGGNAVRVTWRWHLWGDCDDPADCVESGVESYRLQAGQLVRLDG